MMDRLEYPGALVAIPLILLAALWFARRRRPAAVALPTLNSAAQASWRTRAAIVPGLLRVAALVALAVALARPQDVIGRVRSTSEGIAILLVVDRSASMGEPLETERGPSSRIDVVKGIVRDFMLGDGRGLKGREGDLVGMVAFARYADTICPLVRSPESLVALCEQTRLADPRSAEGGTAIGDGIALAAARLRSAEEELRRRPGTDAGFNLKSKVMIVLTDGQDNASRVQPREAATLAAEWGIRIHTIGVGSGPRSVRVQGLFGDREIPVGGGVDEALLEEIAKRTGGTCFLASDGESLREIYERIDEMEKTEIRSSTRTLHEERFQALAIAALAMVAIEAALASTVLRRAP